MKYKVFFALLVLLASSAFAVSSQQAISFAQSSGYIASFERAEIFPNSKISLGSDSYWVIAVLVDETASGDFVAVKDAKQPEIELKKSINSQLFKTAYILREFSSLKTENASRGTWFYSTQNSSFFSTLRQKLSTEKTDLSIIREEVSETETLALIDSMTSMLEVISVLSQDLSSAINSEITFEAAYISSPSTESLSLLEKEIDSVDSPIKQLEEKSIEYNDLKAQLIAAISKLDKDVGVKSYLASLAEPPSELASVSGKKSTALSNIQSVESIYNSSTQAAVNAVDNFDSRIEMVKAFSEIEGSDLDIANATAGSYTTLKTVAGYILNENNRVLWQNQAGVADLESNYSKAVSSFNAKNYSDAIAFAQRAKDNVVDVLNSGIAEPVETPIEETALNIAILIVILIILVLVAKNLPKILGKFKKEEDEEFNLG